jgi:hypothetical protein
MNTGASLATFLNTGQLGPLTLGMNPSSVEIQLGPPEQSSRKLKPLVLKYGPLELTFWSAREQPPQLVQMSLMLLQNWDRLPYALHFYDWTPTAQMSLEDFQSFAERVHVRSNELSRGENESEILFPSGVRAVFVRTYLFALHLSKRETESNQAPILRSEHEPSLSQIRSQLEEAKSALRAGLRSAAVLLAWAGLEAVLRRAALDAGYSGKLRGQPNLLIRELYSLGRLSLDERKMLEAFRQQRTSIAHGLVAEPIDEKNISDILQFSQRLLDRL